MYEKLSNARRALKEWRAEQGKEGLRFGAEYEDHGFVFTTPFGKPLDTYRHVLPSMQEGSAEKLAAMLGEREVAR